MEILTKGQNNIDQGNDRILERRIEYRIRRWKNVRQEDNRI
jgi:hypothetical protein